MSISFREPPAEASNAVLEAMKKLAAGKSFATPKLRDAPADKLGLKFPMLAVHVPLDKIEPRRPLQSMVESPLWRFLVTAGDGQAIAAVHAMEVGTGSWRLGEVGEGPSIEGTEVALEKANADRKFAGAVYEPVLLQAPAIALVALWLRGPEAGVDRLIPIPPSSASFVAYEVLPPDVFLEQVTAAAATVPRRDTTRGG
jgi:hypothetical protein